MFKGSSIVMALFVSEDKNSNRQFKSPRTLSPIRPPLLSVIKHEDDPILLTACLAFTASPLPPHI